MELVHESLIHSWPTLRRWLDEGQEDAAFLEQVRSASRQWQAMGKDGGLLWRGEMVEEARRFKRRYRGELAQGQRDFLEAVLANAARAVRLRRALVVGAGAVLLLLVAASAVALVLIRGAQRSAEEQAVAAKAAEERATQNLLVAQREGEQRKAAQEELEKALQTAEEARKRAEDALERARRLQRVASQQSELARQKEEDAAKAKAALQKKIEAERKRSGINFELKK